MAVILKSTDEVNKMRQAGRVAAQVQALLRAHAVPGTTTKELDMLAANYLKQQGAKSPAKRFPSSPTISISLNDEVLNGVPSKYALRAGDVLKLDVAVTLNNWYAMMATTVPIGQISGEARRLLQTTEQALSQGIAAARPSNRLQDISQAIQQTVEAAGFSVVRGFGGSGVGRSFHEDPQVFGYVDPGHPNYVLKPGMVLYLLAIVTAGSAAVEESEWALFTVDRSLSAMFGQTVAITREGPDILTQ